MKAIPWILVVVLGAGCLVLLSQYNQQRAELIDLRLRLDDGTETVPSPGVQGTSHELDRLRREAEEVHRLRGEVAQLRRDNKLLLEQLSELGQDDPLAMTDNDPFLDEFPPLTPEEEAQQKLELEHAIACVDNLEELEKAKTKWATENSKTGGDPVPLNEVMPYLTNQTMPLCPSGGTYVFNEVGIPPSCSVEGHSLLP